MLRRRLFSCLPIGGLGCAPHRAGTPCRISALALTRLLGHEVGHTVGLGHPNEQRNFEYDSDPVDIEVVALRPR
jgi:hypothetical protein